MTRAIIVSDVWGQRLPLERTSRVRELRAPRWGLYCRERRNLPGGTVFPIFGFIPQNYDLLEIRNKVAE